MRIAFCGHPYHRTTGSPRFILEALRSLGVVEEHWAGESESDLAPLVRGGHDAIVVWQVEWVALRLAEAGLPNVTFFPMYDSCHAYPDSYWRRLSGLKVVSFSNVLQARLQRLGVRARFARYYPEVPSEQVDHGAELAGFFWQRQQDVTWATIRPLLGDAPFRRFTLHGALDPDYGELVRPAPEDGLRLHLRTTSWFPTPAEARADLLSHNVYFAPRLREGIGMSFLEAMALGFLVVAPDRPTMNEYITSGVNGLLYDPEQAAPLDFARRREMGMRARQAVEAGRERWRRSLPALLELVTTPTREVPIQAPLGALDPLSFDPGRPASADTTRRNVVPLQGSRAAERVPLVTITVLDPGGDADARLRTLESVMAQDWPRLELVLAPSAARDGAEDPASPPGGTIERSIILPGLAGASALDAAVEAATGDHLLFLASGDLLPASDTLSRALRGAPPEADLIVGGHLCRDECGNEEACMAADPAQAYGALRLGAIGWRWIESLPAPCAVLWRPTLLRRLGFRNDLTALAHQEALLRAVQLGARVHHALEPLATHPCLRRPVRERRALLDAWIAVATQHTDRRDALAEAFRRMRADVRTHALHRLPWGDVLLSIPAVPGAFRELKRRFRARRARVRGRGEARAARRPGG